MQKKIKVGVAMSGGVDSTVTAALLLEQGYDVHGFFMLLPIEGNLEQEKKVNEIADALNIDLTTIDLQSRFTTSVISYFLSSYRTGLTPNPCIYCNQHIKLGLFMETILTHGMEKIATGHYGQVQNYHNQPTLYRSPDPRKDQSYFLCRLEPKQLDHLLLPLSNWTKEETYAKALALGFEFSGQESQDVCFLPGNLGSFLSDNGFTDTPGDIITSDGQRLGQHRGLWRYTIGQRRGLSIPDATPWYVISLDTENNRLVVGKQHQLLSNRLTVHSLKLLFQPSLFPWQGMVQLRSRHSPARARLVPLNNHRGSIVFDQPQRAITPGQYAAFYTGHRLVGSGIIE